jgi:hypothetical protein
VEKTLAKAHFNKLNAYLPAFTPEEILKRSKKSSGTQQGGSLTVHSPPISFGIIT